MRPDAWSRDIHTPIDNTDIDKRRLRILSGLFKALEARGYQLSVGEPYHRAVQIVLSREKLEVTLAIFGKDKLKAARRCPAVTAPATTPVRR